ncbi:MAG TPA: rRNA maturation RNase YbeY [Gammaproteobacteria bacterium]|nr:rRNA maturation RNase YbeY [Gammaproteobacteria bacterium]
MFHITIQYTTNKTLAPKASLLRQWAKMALSKKVISAEMTIRIVGAHEIALLNAIYRHKKIPTNVLSFPLNIPNVIPMVTPLLGDVIICADVVNQEAREQHKSQYAHWAHMVIHGILHLLGFDHEKKKDAKIMESLEIEILQSLGFTNPYKVLRG